MGKCWLFRKFLCPHGKYGCGTIFYELGGIHCAVFFLSGKALYGTGLVVAGFETGIEYQHGRGSIKDAALNAIKGFMAVSLFTIVPVKLFKLSVSLQSSLTAGITGFGSGFGELAGSLMEGMSATPDLSAAISKGMLGGLTGINNPILMLFLTIMMGYSVIKVFFAPHLLYPTFLDENKPMERKLAMEMGMKVLTQCDEVWCYGEQISHGMLMEIAEADRCGIPVRRVMEQEQGFVIGKERRVVPVETPAMTMAGGISPKQEFDRDTRNPVFIDTGVVSEAFQHKEERRLYNAGCFSFESSRYEASTALVNAKVMISYDPMNTETIMVHYQDVEPVTAHSMKIGSFADKKPPVPVAMTEKMPETSRFLDALERKYNKDHQIMANAISFGDYGKVGE